MKYISKSLSSIPCVSHGFFTRNGGISKGEFFSLNCGYSSADDPKNIIENRNRVCRDLQCSNKQLVTTKQVHGTTPIIVSEEKTKIDQEGDSLITAEPGVVIGVLTADCTPILMADSEAKVIAAVHAGWRGALAGIMQTTVKSMISLGANPRKITAAIGPCIGPNSYKIGPDLMEMFLKKDRKNEIYFSRKTPIDQFSFDLGAYVSSCLKSEGIEEIEVLNIDTYPDSAQFFSHRRSTESGKQKSGRQISAISLIST